ncbi:MAG: metallophosphoesterase family protein [Calditrichia bacterium]
MHSILIFSALLFILHGAAAAAISKGPYLLNAGPHGITIRWEDDIQETGRVEFWNNKESLQTEAAQLRAARDGKYLYEARLSGLKPDMAYHYQVKTAGTESKTFQFRTAPAANSEITFIAMGDSRSNPEIFRTIVQQTGKAAPDLIISMGDLVANGGDKQEWTDFYFYPAADLIARVPFISALGDHEGDDDNGELFRHFLLNDEPLQKQWFSYEYGPVHFIALDYRHPESQEMIDWFKKDMKNNTSSWTVVYMHRPPYNLGGHRSNWGSPLWPQLFRDTKVDLVFAGHSHQYERFYPVRPSDEGGSWPVTYITTGGAGAGLYDVVPSSFLAVSRSVHHFVKVQVSSNKLNLTAYKMDGSELDHISITKTATGYADDYLQLVKPQEKLDMVSMFARAISFTLGQIPLAELPATASLQLHPLQNRHPVDCEIALTPESEKIYRMEPVKVRLPADFTKQLPLQIFSKKPLSVSVWGDIQPELRLVATIKSADGVETVMGKAIDYWPDRY